MRLMIAGMRLASRLLTRLAVPLAPRLLAAAALGSLASPGAPAHAQKLDARYVISMTGIRVGQSAWTVNIDNDRYSASASGGSVDLLNVLLRGEGVARVSGDIREGRLVPALFSSSLIEDGDKVDLKMTLDDGTVTAVQDNAPPPGTDRVPLAKSHAQGIIDPITALLLPGEGSGGPSARETCNRTLPIFDGRRRYDLVLSFKRMEDIPSRKEDSRVLVCTVVLRPIAGHRADSMIMRYVAGRRDIEIAFARITGTHLLAPLRFLLPTLLGTMAVQATSFETTPLDVSARQ